MSKRTDKQIHRKNAEYLDFRTLNLEEQVKTEEAGSVESKMDKLPSVEPAANL